MRPGTRTAIVIASALTAALAGTGCELAAPEVPTFTTTLTLPFGQQRFTADELLAETDYLTVGGDSTLTFEVTGDADTLAIEAELGADVTALDLHAAVGNFAPDIGPPTAFAFRLDRLYPEATVLDGTTTSVPPFSFSVLSSHTDLENIQSLTVASGSLSVTVDNGLPVPVGGPLPPERLEIDLLDPADGALIAGIAFEAALLPGASATESVDLTGVVLPDSVVVRLRGGSAGAAAAVAIDAGAEVTVTTELLALTARAAVAVIGPQSFADQETLALPDTVRLVSAQVSEGELTLTAHNNLAVPCEATLRLPEVWVADGGLLQVDLSLPARASTTRSVPLAGCLILSPDGTPLAALRCLAEASTPGSGGEAVELAADDGLEVTVAPGRLSFGEVTGLIPRRAFAVTPYTHAIDLPEDIEGISLTAAALVLDVSSTAGVPATIDISLAGTSARGSVAAMEATVEVPAAGDGQRRTQLVLDQSNSDIVTFLNNLPSTVTFAGTVTIGGEDCIGTVRPDDQASVAWRLQAPLSVIIAETNLAGDPQPLDLSEETRRRLVEHLATARVSAVIVNHLPFAVQIRLLAGPDAATVTTAPELIVGPLGAPGGMLDAQLHTVSAAIPHEQEIALTAAQTAVLTRPGLVTAVEILLPGTGGEAVTLSARDYLEVMGAVLLEVEVH